MKRLNYILGVFAAVLFAGCTQVIVFDGGSVVPDVPVGNELKDNQIWYTTSGGGTVSPQNMPAVESNVYVNGKGIITFSQKLTAIETRAFKNCGNLVTVTLPDCIETIATEAFRECSSLTKINIPKSVSVIDQEAFCKCLSLKSITIPSSVDAIGYCAFESCHNLATLTFEGGSDASNLTSIDGGAFNNCSSLKTLVLPNRLRHIGQSAFSNCTSLTTVTLPDDLEFVDGAVFSGCSALKEFKGNNVSADGRCLIHNGVMKGFAPSNLTSYTLPDNIESLCNHLFEDFTTITSITLPSSLRNIGEWCFSGCNGLTSITIPERVDNIEAYAFYSCEKLAAVYAKPTDPPTLSTDVFGGDRSSSFKIYVAAQNIDKYKSSWSSYKSYIVADKSGDPIATDWSIVGTHCAWTVDNGTQMTISGEYAVANGVTFASDGEFKFVANKSWDINYGVEPGTTVKLGETYQGKASADNIKVAAGTYNIKFSIYDATFVIEKGSINPNTVITYTSTDGNIVTPYQPDVFGANIISNTYQNDQGQIVFDGEVTKVGYDAFNGCTTLASIALPEGVTELGYRAFRGCSELTRVTLPNSITTFADHVFNACGKLESIALPKSLKKIGSYAFNNCNSLEFVHVFDIADWCNITFSNNTSTPLYYAKKLYCNGVEVTEANIPEGITAISDYAFYNCVPLTKVTIPASVTSIGGYAFTNCSNIKYVYCNPTTPPTIGSYVFMHVADGSYHYTNCTIYVPENSVTAYMSAKGWVDYADRIMSAGYANNVIRYTSTDGKVVTPYSADVFGVSIVSNTYENGQGTIVLSDNPTKIGAFAFRDCKTLKTISIPTTVLEIGNSAFNNCSSLESIYIPGSVTTIGTQAFYGCNSIESVRIPDSVTSIGEVAFGFCASLSEFKGKFASSDGRCLVVDGTLNSFAQAGVTEYTLPKTVKTIGFYAMHNSAQLTTVTIPQSVTAIAEGAFNGCISLESVYCKPTTTPAGAAGMFDNNHPNRKIYVPSTVVNAYKSAQHWSTYADAIFADADPANCQILYTSTDGNVVTPNNADVFGATIVSNTYENGQGVIAFDGEVTKIGEYAFANCSTIASITIPDSVLQIDNWAFVSCTNLAIVSFGNSLTQLGSYVFYQCANITAITIPQNLTTLGANPFMSCNKLAEFNGKFASADKRCLIIDNEIRSFAPAGLKEYSVLDGVTSIGQSAFEYCGNLTSVVIPNSVTKIGDSAFRCCGISSVIIPDNVTSIEKAAFYGSRLTTVTIPDKVTSIGKDGFNACGSLASVYCKPTTPPAGDVGMFDGNAVDRKIYVPSTAVDAYKSAQHWSDYADAIFADADPANCQILYTSTDGNVVTPYATDVFGANIVSNTYENGQGVITFDGEVTTIGPNAFWTRVNLASITLPHSVTSIGYYAFQGCTNLRNITIPDSVTAIDTNPFLDCKALEEFNGKFASADKLCLIVNGVLNTFAIGSGVIEYNISSDVNIVGSSSFAGCTTLTKVTIPSSTTVIRAAAFSNCSNLASIYCQPITPPTGGSNMFNNNAANRKIYVPATSVEAYKSAQHWSEYVDSIVAEGGDATIGGFEMVFVEGGTFTMGATAEQGSDAYGDESPTHSVTLSSYYIGKYEVTQAQWRAVMGSNPSKFTGDNLPVECVSWNDIQEFITKLNQQTGKTFRLPTEAEWEYAARGGNKSKGYKYSGSNTIDDVAWYDNNSSSTTHPVGEKAPNELGIYDMSGNVWERCQDWYRGYSSDSQTNPTGPTSGSARVLRGGSWGDSARKCRVSIRNYYSPDSRSSYIGFRLACASE